MNRRSIEQFKRSLRYAEIGSDLGQALFRKPGSAHHGLSGYREDLAVEQ
jgi:hypothetical protein